MSDLLVKISGSDRQILGGHIPNVSILARRAVYQGLHLTQIHLVGNNIRINLSAVLKGQPLRLLEPVPVFSELLLQEVDLNASLQSPLLANALTDLLSTLLLVNCPADSSVSWHNIRIDPGQLVLNATLAIADNPQPLVIRTGLQLASSHELRLEHPQIQMGGDWRNLESFKLDLGSEVDLQVLALDSGQIVCHGRINVAP